MKFFLQTNLRKRKFLEDVMMKNDFATRENKENVPVYIAAKIMGVSEQFVRVGLQSGSLPFGAAVKISGSRYAYYISPQKFEDFTGVVYENTGN